MSKNENKRLVAVSNRLPLTISEENGAWQVRPGQGGLATALGPVMKRNRGVWVGWPGCDTRAPYEKLLEDFSRNEGYSVVGVPLTDEETEKYYWGFSNQSLWPLFHDLLGYCHFSLDHWYTYQEVNDRFADVVARILEADDLVWIHDYQLLMVGAALRKLGLRQTLGYFLHIPFPGVDLFWRMPWKDRIMEGLLQYDLVGFQTRRDWRNFVTSALALVPEAEIKARRRYYTLLQVGDRTVKAGHFPISIDFASFDEDARSLEVAKETEAVKANYPGQTLVLGLDRLDYSKGIPERFLAFERLLEKYPELRGNVTLLQVVVPSRTLVPDYQNLKEVLDQMAGRINSRFAEAGWSPIQYFFRTLNRIQLLAFYRACPIALITPLRDGMNLVAKEFCAASVDLSGVLVLSEFTGSAEEMAEHALLVNPFDMDGTADAIHKACFMEADEKKRRMSNLRKIVKNHDVFRWVKKFVQQM